MQELWNSLKSFWDSLKGDAAEIAAMSTLDVIIQVCLGLGLALAILAVISPFLAKGLMFNPKKPSGATFFTDVLPGRVKAKMRYGRFIRLMRDGAPWAEYNFFQFWLNPWRWFEVYLWFFGLRVIGVPFIQTLYTYDLPRFEKKDAVEEEGRGKEISLYFRKEDKSDHVRTLPFTFFFMVSGAEIQSIPFTVKGSVQVTVKQGTGFGADQPEWKAFFNTDSWNTFLSQALVSIIRSVVRSELTIDDAIGSVKEKLWDPDSPSADSIGKVSTRILARLREYTFLVDGKEQKLEELVSLEILSAEVTDFEAEISEEEMREIRAPIIGRQKGRGRALEGQGEAEFQGQVLKVARESGEHGHTSMRSEAMVRAAEKGTLDALAAAWLAKQMKE